MEILGVPITVVESKTETMWTFELNGHKWTKRIPLAASEKVNTQMAERARQMIKKYRAIIQ